MARRINTRFVITLGIVLALVAAVGVGLFGRFYLRQRDPVYLKAKAEEAEKAGNAQVALRLYGQAAQRAVEAHADNAADLCMKVGDLAMQLSNQETDRVRAESLYGTARSSWQSALSDNPRYLPARQKLAKEDYQWAMGSQQAGTWTALVDNMQKLVELAPKDGTAYAYRAEGRLRLLLSGATGTASVTETIASIQGDLKKAMALDPKSAKPVTLMAELMWLVQAAQARGAGQPKDAQKFEDGAIALLQGFLKQNPNDPEATVGLVSYELQRRQEAEATKLAEAAYAAHPDNVQLANLLALLYYHDNGKAEKVLKDAIAQDPSNTGEYIQLAQFYERTSKRPEAIATFKELLQHPKPGGGIVSFQNDSWEAEAKYQISSLYLDMAEGDGVSTTAGKEDLKQAQEYVERFRAAKSDVGRQSILDGRLQLLHNNVAQAITYLKRAEANLGGAAPSAGRQPAWVQSKMLMVAAYESQKEWGVALQLLEQVLTYAPGNITAVLERANLLNKVARYEEAMAAVEPILSSKPPAPAALQTLALKVKSTSLYGLGNREEADKIVSSLNSTDALLSLAQSHYGQGEFEQTINDVSGLLAKDPGNINALGLAVLANIRLEHKPAAQKLLDQALAKYPGNTRFQVLQATLNKGTGDPVEVQTQIIKSITDDYSRSMAFADMYGRSGDRVKQLESLQEAEAAVENKADRSQDVLADVVDRVFELVLTLGETAKDQASKDKYWDLAHTYVQKAQRFNIDGLSGKLYEGQLQYAQGNKKDGLTTLEQAVTARPDYSKAHTILGAEYMAASRSSDAAEQFRQAIQEKPDNLPALKSLIYIQLQKGDSASAEQAQVYLKQALLFAPHDSQLTEFRDILAINGAGDLAEAIRVREGMYKNDPTNITNLRHLAILYVRAKEPSKAIDLLRPQYEKNPDDLSIADTLARLYRETQKTNEALTIYERFLTSKDAAVRFQATLLLGELYQSMGQTEQAVQTYNEAVGMEPKDSDQGERRLADLYFDRDDMKNADEMYTKLLDKSANKDMLVVRRLAEAKIREEKFADADKLLNATVFKQNPNDSEGLVLQGFSYLKQGKPGDALKTFNTVLAKDPNNLDALHYRAFAQFSMQGDMDQAMKDLLTVKDRNPNAINSRLLLARVYRASQKLTEAASEYRDIVKLQPDSIPARLEYSQFLMGLAEIQKNMLPNNQDDIAYTIRSVNPMQTLQAFLVDSAQRFPTVAMWEILEGNLLTLNERTVDAQKFYAEAFKMSNGSAESADAYLTSLLKTRNYEDVVTLSTKLLEQRADDLGLYLKRASAYVALNKTAEAVADCQRAMDLSAKDAVTAMAVARQAAGILPPDDVLAMCKKRSAASPKDLIARLVVGEMEVLTNHPADAVGALKDLMTDPGAQGFKAYTLRTLALAKYQSKDFAGADADYKELLKTNPDDIEALNNLSFLLAEDEKKPKEALSYASQAVKVLKNSDASQSFVNNGNVYDTYGWVKFLSGDTDGSLSELRKATESAPIAIAYLHLAKAYQKAGQKANASKAVEDGLQLANQQKDPISAQLEVLKKDLARQGG